MSRLQPHAAYKPSRAPWLGQIPSHWDEKPLFAVARERWVANDGLREKNLLSLSYGRIVCKDINANEGLLPESFETYQIIEAGDVVFRLTDLQNDKRSLRSAICQQRGIITSAYLAVVPEGIRPEYFNYLMRAYDVQKVFYSMGGGLRQSLKYEDLRRMPLPIPSADEQNKIVVYLDRETTRIDALIAKKSGFIGLLAEKATAIAANAVSKGIAPKATMVDSGVGWIGHIPSHWSIFRVAALFREVARPANIELPVLSVSIHGGVTDKELADEERDRVVNLSEDRTKYQSVKPEDLVYNMMRAWQGAFGTVAVEGLVSPAYVVAEPKTEFRTKFVELLLQTPAGFEEVRRYSKGIADFRMRLYWEHFRNLKVCLPPLPEQDAIIRHVAVETARIKQLISTTERSIELLKEHRSALITAAITGKIDVRGIDAKKIQAAA